MRLNSYPVLSGSSSTRSLEVYSDQVEIELGIMLIPFSLIFIACVFFPMIKSLFKHHTGWLFYLFVLSICMCELRCISTCAYHSLQQMKLCFPAMHWCHVKITIALFSSNALMPCRDNINEPKISQYFISLFVLMSLCALFGCFERIYTAFFWFELSLCQRLFVLIDLISEVS